MTDTEVLDTLLTKELAAKASALNALREWQRTGNDKWLADACEFARKEDSYQNLRCIFIDAAPVHVPSFANGVVYKLV